jgi:hypothetical protein
MPPLPAILNDFIIKSKEKLNQRTLKLIVSVASKR